MILTTIYKHVCSTLAMGADAFAVCVASKLFTPPLCNILYINKFGLFQRQGLFMSIHKT